MTLGKFLKEFRAAVKWHNAEIKIGQYSGTIRITTEDYCWGACPITFMARIAGKRSAHNNNAENVGVNFLKMKPRCVEDVIEAADLPQPMQASNRRARIRRYLEKLATEGR